jgi:aspartate racemase
MNKLGIIAGMGPMAGVALYKTIIENTKASHDQEHIPFLLYNLPQIPDRTAAILNKGDTPVPYIVFAAQTLEKAGVEYILMACNTAHYYIQDIQKEINAKIINIIDLVWHQIEILYPYVIKVGLLATDGVIQSKIYEPVNSNKKLVYPNKGIQNDFVMESIYGKNGIKAGNINSKNKKLLIKASNYLIDQGVDVIVMGCTEIPLVINSSDISVSTVNPIEIMALEAIKIMKDNKEQPTIRQLTS